MLAFFIGLGGRIGISPPLVTVAEAVRLRLEGFFLPGEATPPFISNGDCGGEEPGEGTCVPPTPPPSSGSGREPGLTGLCLRPMMRVPRGP